MKVAAALLAFLFTIGSASAFTERDVTFTSGAYTLYGTLSIPEGAGPFPVVIFVHGSGPSDRDETVQYTDANSQCLYPGLFGTTSKMFKELSDDLATGGVAVLRYDKRSFTYGAQLDVKTLSTQDFIDDIVAAVNFVRTRSEIDPNRVILLGHSEGANFVPLAARQASGVAGLIEVAGAAYGIDSVFVGQIRHIYRTCADSAQGEAIAQQLDYAFWEVRKGTWPENTPIVGAYPKYWREWIGITDSTVGVYRDATLPTLFLAGSEDINVRPDHFARFQAGVTRPSAHFVMFEGLMHQFSTLQSPAVPQYVADTILAWLRRTQIAASVDEPSREIEATSLRVSRDAGAIIFHSRIAGEGMELTLYSILGERITGSGVIRDERWSIPAGTLRAGVYLYAGRAGGKEVSGTILIAE